MVGVFIWEKEGYSPPSNNERLSYFALKAALLGVGTGRVTQEGRKLRPAGAGR